MYLCKDREETQRWREKGARSIKTEGRTERGRKVRETEGKGREEGRGRKCGERKRAQRGHLSTNMLKHNELESGLEPLSKYRGKNL